MKKVLITGCSGYIGSHLNKMLRKDYLVHGLDIVEPIFNMDRFYNFDINRHFNIDEEYDAVIHLAALVNVGESEKIPIMYYITNINGTMNVLNKIKTKNFIFASTGAAESCKSAYGVSKRAAEDVVKEYCTMRSQVPYTTFRFYNVIGTDGFKPTNPDGLMFNLIKAMETKEFNIYGKDYSESWDGTAVRDYVHVNEICEALKTAIEKPSNNIECLGHGKGYTVQEIVEKFQEVNNTSFNINFLPRRDGDLAFSVLENVSPFMKELYTIDQLLSVDKLD